MKLHWKYFGTYFELCDFINQNNIDRKDIQLIDYSNPNGVGILYWSIK